MKSSTLHLILMTVLVSCGGNKDAEPTPAADPAPAQPGAADAAATAKDLFAQRCVPCHGSTGQGDGPAAASLTPKPAKYADAAWQASVTDEYIEKIIKYGGTAVGKSPAMPGNPDLNDPKVVSALRGIVRAFGSK